MRPRPILTAVTALLLGAGAAHGASPEPYTFAVVPQGPPEQMRSVWLPIVERLALDSGVPLRLQLHAHAEEFQADLAAGRVDLAYANPVQAIRAHGEAGYRPLVRDAKKLHGVFFVAADAPYTSVESLARHEVAFIAPWTFCSETLRAYTRTLGIAPRYVGTAANAYKSVLLGLTPAGGVLDSSLADAPPEIRARLRVIYETPAMAAHAVIAHPRVPRDVAARVTAAIMALAASKDAALLAPAHLGAPVEAEYARDYAPLEVVIHGTDPARGPRGPR